MKHKWVANGCSCHHTCMKCDEIVKTSEKDNAPPCKKFGIPFENYLEHKLKDPKFALEFGRQQVEVKFCEFLESLKELLKKEWLAAHASYSEAWNNDADFITLNTLSAASNMVFHIEKLILNMPEVKKGYLFEEKK